MPTGYTLCLHMHMLQAEVVTKLRTFADACANPSAKRITVHGRTGPVNAVEVDGTLFIQNDEAEAEAEAIRSKAMEPASEVAAASKRVATAAAASEVEAPGPVPKPAVATAALEPAASPAVVKSNSYAAAVSKPPVGPKFSVAASQPAAGPKLSSQLSTDHKRSSAAFKPAAVLTPLEVNIQYPHTTISLLMCTVPASPSTT